MSVHVHVMARTILHLALHFNTYIHVCMCKFQYPISDAVVPTSGTFDVKMVKTASLNLGITINGMVLTQCTHSTCSLIQYIVSTHRE